MFGDTPPPTQPTLQKIGVPVAFKAKELVLSFKPIIHLHIRLLTANTGRYSKVLKILVSVVRFRPGPPRI